MFRIFVAGDADGLHDADAESRHIPVATIQRTQHAFTRVGDEQKRPRPRFCDSNRWAVENRGRAHAVGIPRKVIPRARRNDAIADDANAAAAAVDDQ